MAASIPRPRPLVLALTALAALAAQAESRAAGACSVRSARTITPVVELYTSEGCNSCPPADRWISRLKAEPEVVALAFHVDYWDRLGWKDRFGSPLNTQRQTQQEATSGGRFSYTPQVIVDGADRKDWPGIATPLATAGRKSAVVEVSLAREGDHVTATVLPTAGAPKRLAAYWAVTEQGHVTAVKAGENEGVTLHHDYVVRDYQPVAAWSPKGESAQTLVYDLRAASDPAHPRDVNLVVIDAGSGRPVQAVKMGC
jgi:hypothetical protein